MREDAPSTHGDLPPTPARLAPLDVLVVDDDAHLRAVLARAVEAQGHRVRVAPDGEVAWRLFQETPADVVLSDWEMPLVNGVELCRRVRASASSAPYTYFVLITAHDDNHQRIRNGMAAGADDFQRKPIDLEDLEARLLAAGRVVALHRELVGRNSALAHDSQRFFDASRTDALTGLGNRARMNEELDAATSRAQRYGERLCLAICDLDHFKSINDERGHLAGDEVIARVSRVLRANLRASDGVFRFGGDELVVLFASQGVADATVALERIRQDVERLDLRTKEGRLTLSVGVAELSSSDTSSASWLARADAALYVAKRAGRNRVVTA